MDANLSALLWVVLTTAVLTLLYAALTRRSRRIVAAYSSLRRRAPGNALSLLADLHVRRALWFALLDNMHDRYTLLLQSARASHRGGKSIL